MRLMPGTFRLVRSEIGFTLILFFATTALVHFCQRHSPEAVHFSIQLAWAAVVTMASYAFLDGLKYLDSFRPRPSRADLLTL